MSEQAQQKMSNPIIGILHEGKEKIRQEYDTFSDWCADFGQYAADEEWAQIFPFKAENGALVEYTPEDDWFMQWHLKREHALLCLTSEADRLRQFGQLWLDTFGEQEPEDGEQEPEEEK